MPQHKSAKKRLRQSVRKSSVNKNFKSQVNTEIKKLEKLITDKSLEDSVKKLQVVMSLLHKSAKKKIIHLNNASRRISKLQKKISSLN